MPCIRPCFFLMQYSLFTLCPSTFILHLHFPLSHLISDHSLSFVFSLQLLVPLTSLLILPLLFTLYFFFLFHFLPPFPPSNSFVFSILHSYSFSSKLLFLFKVRPSARPPVRPSVRRSDPKNKNQNLKGIVKNR